jgi:putative flippase GtrA
MIRRRRFARFYGVAALGAAIQLATIAAIVDLAGYLLATAVGVAAALVHNFFWHVRWTWRDRAPAGAVQAVNTLGRFALANGAVSLVGNMILMTALVGIAGMPPLVANVVSITACGLINFEVGDRFVF